MMTKMTAGLMVWLMGCGAAWTAEQAPSAPPPVAVQESSWNGYQKQSFTVGGAAAYVVVPKIAAPGKPWVWRTSFPDYRPVVDLELVRQGFHIGYVEILNLLGSDASLDLMDLFYAQVRSQWGLAIKFALEPCSRGGLPAYRYAARHPERVACIYGDVPVMDFKSWPWNHPASKASDWPLVLKAYGFKSDAEAMAYPLNPLDQLEPLARARIPIRHVISLNDRVVPPEQNTLEAQRRLERLGSGMDVVSVKEGPECEGHHFEYPDVFGSVRFIMRHAAVLPGDREHFELRNGLAHCRAKFEKEKTGRVVFLGGSITAMSGWREEVMQYLQQRFPETTFDFIGAGVPSVGSVGHAFRLERDVLMRGPVDLVFVEAAVNDHNYEGLPEPAALALRGMEGVVRHLRTANPQTDVVLMHFIDGRHLDAFGRGQAPYTVEAHEAVAAHYGCPSLNLSREVFDRIQAGHFTWESGFHQDVHAPPYGQRVYINSMTRMLDAGFAAPSKRARAHRLPSKLLDPKSYVRGRYGKLEDAKLGQGFTLDPCWNPAGHTREGFAKVPALVASMPGAELTYAFEGTAVGLFLAAGPDTGVLEFSIDGAPFKKVDTYTPWSGGLHIPWPLVLADGLKPGKHQLVLRTTDGAKNRTALHIIHLLVN